MRQYARLKEPPVSIDNQCVYKIMLYQAREGIYLFTYSSPDAVQSSSDRYYGSLDDLYLDWNGLVDERGWIEMEDPLPFCQHDAFIPLRIKGRDAGKPEWGKYETLIGGKWVDCDPAGEIPVRLEGDKE